MVIPEEMRFEAFGPGLDRSTWNTESPSQHQRGGDFSSITVGGIWVDKHNRDGACANRADADVVLTKVLTVADVEARGEPVNGPLTLIALPQGLTVDDVVLIDGLIFRR